MVFHELPNDVPFPLDDLRRAGILREPDRPDSQAILGVKSVGVLPELDLLRARILWVLPRPGMERGS